VRKLQPEIDAACQQMQKGAQDWHADLLQLQCAHAVFTHTNSSLCASWPCVHGLLLLSLLLL
jgi:hypothetical protein